MNRQIKIVIFNIHGGIGDILYSYNPIKKVIIKENINIILTANPVKINSEFIKLLFHDDVFKNLVFINKKYDNNILNNIINKNKHLKKEYINYRPEKKDAYIKYLSIPNFQEKINFKINLDHSKELYNKVVKKIGNKYILIHERDKDNGNRDMVPINRNHFIKKLPVYNFDFFSKENYGIKSNLIFDYYHIIMNAEEIHLYNGSLLCFIDRINHIFQNVYLHAYCKDIQKRVDYMNWIKEWNKTGLLFGSKIKVID